MARAYLAEAKKKARQERRIIVFLDESGLTERPHRVRTWGQRGRTPVLPCNYRWGNLSIIAAVTRTAFLFRLHTGAVRSGEIVQFLGHLHRHFRRRLLVIWDNIAVHRSGRVRSYLEKLRGAVVVAYLPPYAPELNPVEYTFANLKERQLPNACPHSFPELRALSHRALRRIARRADLVSGAWRAAKLC